MGYWQAKLLMLVEINIPITWKGIALPGTNQTWLDP